MSISSRIEAMEGHIEDIYDTLELGGSDLTNVNKNIVNINEEVKKQYKDFLANGTDELWNNWPKVTGTGSDLSLTPTLKGGLNILPLGNCEQDTTAYIDVGTWEQGGIDGGSGDNYTSNTLIRTKDYIPVKPNVLYNISRSIYSSYMAFRFYNSSKTYLGSQSTSGMVTTNQSDNRMADGVSSMTMTINNTNVAYMRMVDASLNLSTQYTISTQAPTPSYPQDVKIVTGDNQVVVSNKNNLPNIDDYTGTGITISNNIYTCNYEGGINTGIRALKSSYTIKNGDYLHLLNNKANNNIQFDLYLSDNTRIVATTLSNINQITDLSSYVGKTVAKIRVYANNNYNDNITIKPMILHTSTLDTDFIPHQEQSTTLHLGSLELCKIGDYQDVITGTKDNWKVVRKVKKVIYNGSEDWKINGTQLYLDGSGYLRYSDGGRCYCNYFIGSAVDNVIDANLHCWIGNNNFLLIKYTDITTVENFKTWLSTHNLIVYYILATPTEETITDTTLINELNGLQELLSYDGTTNFTITSNSDNAQMLVQISALKGE